MSEADFSKAAVDELISALSACIFCEPLDMQDKFIIPVAEVTLVTGTAGTGISDGGSSGRSSAGRAGGGMGISPAGAVLIHKDIAGREGVEHLPLLPCAEAQPNAAHALLEELMRTVCRQGCK